MGMVDSEANVNFDPSAYATPATEEVVVRMHRERRYNFNLSRGQLLQ